MANTDRISLLLWLDTGDAELDGRLDEDDEAVLESYREELEEEVAAALDELRLEGAADELVSRREAELADEVEDALKVRARELAENHLSDLELCGATHVYVRLTRPEARTLAGFEDLGPEVAQVMALPIDLYRGHPTGTLPRDERDLAHRLEISLTPRRRAEDPDAYVDVGDRDTITFAGDAARALHGMAAKKAVAPPVALELRSRRYRASGYILQSEEGDIPCLCIPEIMSALLASAKHEELREYFCGDGRECAGR